jgi:hypothetical protein
VTVQSSSRVPALINIATRLRILGNGTVGHVALTIAHGFTNYGEIELGNTVHVWRGDLTVSEGALINEGLIRSTSVTATNDHVNVLAAELINRGTLRIERVLRLAKANARHENTGSVHLVSGNLTADLAATLSLEVRTLQLEPPEIGASQVSHGGADVAPVRAGIPDLGEVGGHPDKGLLDQVLRQHPVAGDAAGQAERIG